MYRARLSNTASVHYIKEMAGGLRDGKMKIKFIQFREGGGDTLFGYQQFVTQLVGSRDIAARGTLSQGTLSQGNPKERYDQDSETCRCGP